MLSVKHFHVTQASHKHICVFQVLAARQPQTVGMVMPSSWSQRSGSIAPSLKLWHSEIPSFMRT